MRERLKDKMRLEHIMEAIDRLQKHAGSLSREELELDVLRYYGIVKNIEIIGEAARMLSDDFKNAHPDVPWLSISNMWNFLVHEYFQVDSLFRCSITVHSLLVRSNPVLGELRRSLGGA